MTGLRTIECKCAVVEPHIRKELSNGEQQHAGTGRDGVAGRECQDSIGGALVV